MNKVSIIIPNFNRAGLIKETLNSVLAQTYPHWEALVVDDGSTDKSLEVVQEFAAADSRIKLIPRDRLLKGAPTCRNIGIERSSGDFIIFLDSDDLIAPHCLAQRIETAAKNPAFDLYVFPASGFYKEIGDVPAQFSGYEIKPGHTFYDFAAGNMFFITGQAFWRKKFLLDHDLYFHEELRSGQDFHFHYQAYFNKARALFAPVSIDHYIRWSSEGRITNYAKDIAYDESRFKILQYIVSQRPDKQIKQYAYDKICLSCFSYTYIWRMNAFMLQRGGGDFLKTEATSALAAYKLSKRRLRGILKDLKSRLHVGS